MIRTNRLNIFYILKYVISLPQSLCCCKLQVFVTEMQVAVSLRQFVSRRFTVMTGLKTSGQKYQKTIKIFKKCATINIICWCKEATQPIRDESFPHLPSKLISVIRKTAAFTVSIYLRA